MPHGWHFSTPMNIHSKAGWHAAVYFALQWQLNTFSPTVTPLVDGVGPYKWSTRGDHLESSTFCASGHTSLLVFPMASPSNPNKVRAPGRFYGVEAWSSYHKLASGFDEHEQQVIDDGLGRHVNEVQQRCNASQNSPPKIPPRPNRFRD